MPAFAELYYIDITILYGEEERKTQTYRLIWDEGTVESQKGQLVHESASMLPLVLRSSEKKDGER